MGEITELKTKQAQVEETEDLLEKALRQSAITHLEQVIESLKSGQTLAVFCVDVEADGFATMHDMSIHPIWPEFLAGTVAIQLQLYQKMILNEYEE